MVTDLSELINHIKELISKYPHFKGDLIDIYQMAKDEIEEGGSEHHEIELAVESINELIGEV